MDHDSQADNPVPSTLRLPAQRRPVAAVSAAARSSGAGSPNPASARDLTIAATLTSDGDVPSTSIATVDSEALLKGKNRVSIMHNGETYQLRATRFGKLILTK